MPERLSEVFGIRQPDWDLTLAFDAFVGVDARLHIDPYLLASSEVPEFSEARTLFDNHFTNVITVLRHVQEGGAPFLRQATRLLTFPEIPNTGLGYAKENKRGSGIGATLAAGMAELGQKIVEAGIEDPDIFALMGLLQDGIGADRISDMTAAIVVEPLLRYNDRVVRELGLAAGSASRGGNRYAVPKVPNGGERVLVVPRDILRHLPVAHSWSEIDLVASHNEQLRARVNSLIGDTWRKASRIPKRKLRETLLQFPELIRDLLAQYHRKPAVPYDLSADPDLLHLWQPIARDAVAELPLDAPDLATDGVDEVVQVVRIILTRFKQLIESNRLYRLLYNDDGSTRRERAAQLALFGVADAYCQANDLDLSPETDSGNGPVDFKFSRGYRGRVLAEVKLSSNAKLVQGYDNQVRAYQDAEGEPRAFYVVLRVGSDEARVNRLIARVNEAKQSGQPCPELVLIDARPTDSASNR